MNAAVLSHPVSFRLPTLAWSSAADDERRFQRIARSVVLVVAVLGLVLPFVPLRTPERPEIQPLPAPMAKLLLDDKHPPRQRKPLCPAPPTPVSTPWPSTPVQRPTPPPALARCRST